MIDVSRAALPLLEPRDRDTHKGDYGRGLVIGGSLGMAGAPALAGVACLRSGAGYTTVATPACVQPTVAGYFSPLMTQGLRDDGDTFAASAESALLRLAQLATAVAIGPGIGGTPAVRGIVIGLYTAVAKPMVVDADGLNALADAPSAMESPGGPRVLTPHAGEFARLIGRGAPEGDSARVAGAAELARRDVSGATVVVLKGPRTVVTDGQRFAVNTTGNPGMATAGAGDVLSGVVTALLCQRMPPFDAARLGVFVHGLAGDLAADKIGEVSLTAIDLVAALPEAWRSTLDDRLDADPSVRHGGATATTAY